jgi:hypothetical protein
MNDPHKFGTEFGSDHALEQSTPIVSHHDTIKWFEAIPGEQLCIRVHGTQVNGRYAIMENIAAPGTPHVDLLFTRWSRRALPQACRLVARRAIHCSRTIPIRHCWAAHR